ncbi:hypothetical protein FB446DRAFT_711587 [Lentinula raphanica]|nr:hypothetical protein FB446DRAFT_711587 [Lentinula raphanica]
MSTISNDNALKNVPPPNIYTSKTSFEQLLEASRLPPPGPSYYVARRALWLRCPPDTNATARESSPSVSRNKLENLLSTPAAIYDDEIWESGIHKVWKGLSAGASLKRRLPLNLVVRAPQTSTIFRCLKRP